MAVEQQQATVVTAATAAMMIAAGRQGTQQEIEQQPVTGICQVCQPLQVISHKLVRSFALMPPMHPLTLT